MSKNTKDSKTLDKLKQFFRTNRGGGAGYRLSEAFVLVGDVEREISPDTPLPQRMKTIKELSEVVLNHHVEEESIKKMWHCVKDLLEDYMPREHRHLAFHFLRCLVQGQSERLGMARVHYFQLIKNHKNSEDVGPRLELLTALLDGGKHIEYLEEEVAKFMVEWTGEISAADKEAGFLTVLVNLVKYNAAYIDKDVMHGLVHNVSMMAMQSTNVQVITLCLQVLENIVCYSTLPPQSLQIYICCLCRIVNSEAFCNQCWKIMRNLLGTHMGHRSIYTMVRLMQDPTLRNDPQMLRGACFHITFALWSCKRVEKLSSQFTYSSILPAYLCAVKSRHSIVVFEVVQALHRIVTKYGLQLVDTCWTILLTVLEAVIEHIETTPSDQFTPPITSHVHETLCTMETMIELGQFQGPVRTVFNIIDRCSSIRPESSVMKLITYLSRSVRPTQAHWLGKLHSILDRYLHQETRTNIRLRALEVLSSVIQANRLHFEAELIEGVVLPHMEHIDEERDVSVRNAEAALVVDVCVASVANNKHFLELLDILDRLLLKAFAQHDAPAIETEVQDVKTTVEGVIRIFTSAMYHVPSSHAIKAFGMLVTHLEMHYAKPIVFENIISIRVMILECFIRLRVDNTYRLGYPASQPGLAGPIRYSQYLLVENSPPPVSPPPPFPSYGPLTYPAPVITRMSLSPACLAYITCLRQELDWRVLQPMIQGVVQVVQHKALILAKHTSDIQYLASTLCSMVSDKNMCTPDLLRNTQGKLTRSDMQGHVFPVLAALASYHARLEFNLQQRVIKCLEFGLASRSVRQCVLALTSCVLEMRDAMVKLLPEVLLNLSKISATVQISIPILEFLSTLSRLPKLYANFVGDQYMAVFAIALPYTSPFKYNHYTVSLAHHVIAVWFLKCRLSFRKDFVRFMILGLKANVLMPFEDTQMRRPTNLINEDSSNRKRSSSLTEQGSRRLQPAIPPAASGSRMMDLKPPINESLMQFHQELTETCIDLMTRYTYTTCSGPPIRSPMDQLLFSESQSSTWLMGNRLITVTTSGCGQKPLKNSLCDRCYHSCRLEKDKQMSPCVEKADQSISKTSLSRSGSVEMGSTGEDVRKSEKTLSDPEHLIYGVDRHERSLCSCWCQGWSEIHIRRPTGDVSWKMRLQNDPHSQEMLPFNDFSSMFLPPFDPSNPTSEIKPEVKPLITGASERLVSEPVSIPGSPVRPSPSRHSSRDSVDTLGDEDLDAGSGRSRNPVRRSNSSPEMSASWKNPFMSGGNQGAEDPSANRDGGSGGPENKKKQTYTKDLRVNCEAIPEEMGTTPPTADLTLPVHAAGSSDLKVTLPAVAAEWPTDKPKKSDMGATSFSKAAETQPADPGRLGRDRPREEERGAAKPVAPAASPSPLLTTKPPLSPPALQLSPRLQPKLLKVEGEVRPDPASLPPLAFKRDRGHTISVMSPVRKPQADLIKSRTPRNKEMLRSGVSPSFVFLQLYHQGYFGDQKPLFLDPHNQVVERAFKNLDRIQPYETHKVGVIYVGPGQANNEVEILRNPCGSFRYTEFLEKLGTLVRLESVDPQNVFLGGLERSGKDGKFAYTWKDDVTQVIFHVATLMPNRDTDPNCNDKKLHIGNDYVTIVYNESGEPYNRSTVKCQFNYTCVVVEPLDHNINLVSIKAKEELVQHIGHSEPKLVSDENVGLLARQLALHSNLASRVACSLTTEGRDPYTSNWLERLRQIKRIRAKILADAPTAPTPPDIPASHTPSGRRVNMDDFTEYA